MCECQVHEWNPNGAQMVCRVRNGTRIRFSVASPQLKRVLWASFSSYPLSQSCSRLGHSTRIQQHHKHGDLSAAAEGKVRPASSHYLFGHISPHLRHEHASNVFPPHSIPRVLAKAPRLQAWASYVEFVGIPRSVPNTFNFPSAPECCP